MPHSDIFGSKFARNSPKLLAACHVLHRLCMPRHPPNALILRLRTFIISMIKMILRYLKISDKNGYLVYSLIIQYNMRASPHIAPNNATTSKTHLQCQISIQNQSPDFRQIHDKTRVFISWNTIIYLLWWAPFALANNQITPRGAKSRDLVGRGGLEPPTSRLSGVRSNHLSYRPQPCLFTLKSECEFGGANRDRTDDLKLAKLALSQLSYGPLINTQPRP